jgi:hypothetical protein
VQALNIYADANNFYEALSAAFNESILVIQHFDKLPMREKDKRFISGGNNEVINFTQHFDFTKNDFILDPPFETMVEAACGNIYEALSLAFNDVLQEIQKKTKLPIFGRKENYSIIGWKERYGYAPPKKDDEEI